MLVKKVKSVEFIQPNKKSKDDFLLGTVITTCISTVLCWLPSGGVFMTSLVVPNYPYRLLVWTIISVLSLNAMVDPVILNLKVFIKIMVCQFKSKLESDQVPKVMKDPLISTILNVSTAATAPSVVSANTVPKGFKW